LVPVDAHHGHLEADAVARHLASTWLTWGPEIYSQTDTST